VKALVKGLPPKSEKPIRKWKSVGREMAKQAKSHRLILLKILQELLKGLRNHLGSEAPPPTPHAETQGQGQDDFSYPKEIVKALVKGLPPKSEKPIRKWKSVGREMAKQAKSHRLILLKILQELLKGLQNQLGTQAPPPTPHAEYR
jgi:hypothetical protein